MTLEIKRMNPGLAQAVQPRFPVGSGQNQVVPGAEVQQPESQLSTDKVKLTQPEEEYFATAFPSAAKEIHQHALYQKTGIQMPPSLGSVLDRKG